MRGDDLSVLHYREFEMCTVAPDRVCTPPVLADAASIYGCLARV